MTARIKLTDINFSRKATGLYKPRGSEKQNNKDNSEVVFRNLNLDISEGDRVGLIGLNGTGKTTLLRLIAGILTPESGVIERRGGVSLFIDQTYGFDLNLTGFENTRSRCVLGGMSRTNIDAAISFVHKFSELAEDFYKPLKHYSSGMIVRLTFSANFLFRENIFLIDEGIGMADIKFQKKATEFLMNVLSKAEIIVLASHNGDLLRSICNVGAVIGNHKVEFFGDLEEALEYYTMNIRLTQT